MRQAIVQLELAMGAYTSVLQSMVQEKIRLLFDCSEYSQTAEMGIKLHRS